MASVRIQVRRGTAGQWTANNPTPYAGEVCYDTTSKTFKIGDGSTAYATLPYFIDEDAIAALIAWDDSSELLNKSVEEVAELGSEGNHSAILLLPAVVVKYKLKENK